MYRTGIAADNESRTPQDMRKLRNVCFVDEINRRDFHFGFDFFCKHFVLVAAANQHGYDRKLIKPIAQSCKIFCRPTFVRPISSDDEDHKRIALANARMLHNRTRLLRLFEGNLNREGDFVDDATDCPRSVKVAFDDVPLRIFSDDGL